MLAITIVAIIARTAGLVSIPSLMTTKGRVRGGFGEGLGSCVIKNGVVGQVEDMGRRGKRMGRAEALKDVVCEELYDGDDGQ